MKKETLSLIHHALHLDDTISPEGAAWIIQTCQGLQPSGPSVKATTINEYCRRRKVSRSSVYKNLKRLGYHQGYKDFAGRLVPEVVAALDGYANAEVEAYTHGNLEK